jgi:hypothetical protein
MREELEPVVGKWYLDVELDEPFRIAAIDEEREVIQVRYLDGETDEIELDDWSDLDLEPAEPPEDEPEKDDETKGGDWRKPDAAEADDWDDEEEDEDDDDWDDDEEEDGLRDDE